MTSWTHDVHTFGSYSNWPLGFIEDEWLAMTKPLKKKLFFAGEHTHPEYYGYLHGAYYTGIDSAQQVLDLVNIKV